LGTASAGSRLSPQNGILFPEVTTMLKAIVTFFNLLHVALVRVAQALIVGMVLVTSVNVFMRYVLDSGIFWSEEVAILFATWFIFIAMGLGVKQGLHISLTLIPRNRIPKSMNQVLDTVGYLAMIAVSVMMVWYGLRLTKFTSTSIMPATGWPASVQYWPLPVSGVLILYESIVKMVGIDTHDATIDRHLEGGTSLRETFGGHHA
jgi:TRAP-type transport system small permease protein